LIVANRQVSEQLVALRAQSQALLEENDSTRHEHAETLRFVDFLTEERDELAQALEATKKALDREINSKAFTAAHSAAVAGPDLAYAPTDLAEPRPDRDGFTPFAVGDLLGDHLGEPAGSATGVNEGPGVSLALAQDFVPALQNPQESDADAPWPDDEPALDPSLPNVSSLCEARHQIAHLNRLLESAQVANRILRANFSERGIGAIRRQLREMTERAQQLEAELRAYRGKEETVWHAGIAQRARKLDRKG
jgi:hypothetical protein